MKLTQHDVGGEIISILTKGMYADPKDALREYVQNGVDASAKSIDIKIRQNNIVIQDTGLGMNKITMRKAVRLGVSDKNPKKAVGFMGIGLYSSFHLCDKLTIFSKVQGEKPNRLDFEFKVMRDILEAQKEARIDNEEGVPEQIALLSLMEDNTSLTELAEVEFPTVGTRVELSGLDAAFFESLSKFDEVADYLEKAIPLPFSPEFKYGEQIQSHIGEVCKAHNAEFKLVTLKLQINAKEEQLYRPYKDSYFNPEPMPPNYKELTSPVGFLGVAWGCLNSLNEVIKNDEVRGFLIKKQGFTIGTRNNLLATFGAKFFNRYVGEFIIVHPKILPNGARSDFEYSPLRTVLYKVIQDRANEYNSDANRHQEIVKAEIELDKLIEQYRQTKAQLAAISESRDMLLETYKSISKARDSFKRRYDSDWRIKPERKEDAKGILELVSTLVNEISELLTQKKPPSKGSQKSRSQVAKELNDAPVPQEHQEPQPNNLVEVIELIGIPFNGEMRLTLDLLDEQFVKPASKNDADYLDILKRLKGDIEDLFSENENA